MTYYRNPRYILNILNYRWLKTLQKKNNSTVNPNRFNRRRKKYNPSTGLNTVSKGLKSVSSSPIKN